MFTYHIWFKSGNDIEGDMNERNAKELKCLFLHHRKVNPEPQQFEDSDGELFIDILQIEALSLTPIKEEVKPVGFGN